MKSLDHLRAEVYRAFVIHDSVLFERVFEELIGQFLIKLAEDHDPDDIDPFINPSN